MSLRAMASRAGRSVLGKDLYTRLRAGRQREYRFLRHVRGVIHIGANTGQEAELYQSFGLEVIWIEPIPEVFERLCRHVAQFRRQTAFRYLVTGEEGKDCALHVANNDGASSSILDFRAHSEMWPEVKYTHSILVKSITLGALLSRENVDVGRFDGLVLDTQGSELGILTGAAELLSNFRFIKAEVPDFESYRDCCQISELSTFMLSKNFREYSRAPFMHRSGLGTYFDVTYKRERRYRR